MRLKRQLGHAVRLCDFFQLLPVRNGDGAPLIIQNFLRFRRPRGHDPVRVSVLRTAARQTGHHDNFIEVEIFGQLEALVRHLVFALSPVARGERIARAVERRNAQAVVLQLALHFIALGFALQQTVQINMRRT